MQNECQIVYIKEIPPSWPAILLSVVGGISSLMLNFSNISNQKKTFGNILILLWVIIWYIVLSSNWYNKKYTQTWYLAIMPTVAIVVLLVILLTLD